MTSQKPKKKIVDRHHDDEFRHTSPLALDRILVVGASGYIGSAIAMGLRDDYDVMGTHYQNPHLIEGVRSQSLNCLDAGEILNLVNRFQPHLVIYAAGLTDPDACFQNTQLAEALNVRALSLFFKVLSRPVPFMYLSCDKVLSGAIEDENFRFNEDDDVNPSGFYAQSKARGESVVLGHNRLTYVLRAPMIYGETLASPFASKAPESFRALKAMIQSQPYSLADNEYRSTLYIGDFVRAIRAFLRKAPLSSALYHLGSSDVSTPLVLARSLVHKMEYRSDLIKADSSKKESFSAMSAERFCEDFEFEFQTLDKGLDEMRMRLLAGYSQSWL